MFKFILFFTFFTFLYSQENTNTQPKQKIEETAKTEEEQLQNSTNPQEKKAPSQEKAKKSNYYESLDKKYYDFYFETLPNKKKIQSEKLRKVLYEGYKREIYRVRKSLPDNILEKITPKTIKYEEVNKESIWWRGIRKQLKHILETDYMYIVTYDKYYCLFTFVSEPSKYIQSPKQAQLLFKSQ